MSNDKSSIVRLPTSNIYLWTKMRRFNCYWWMLNSPILYSFPSTFWLWHHFKRKLTRIKLWRQLLETLTKHRADQRQRLSDRSFNCLTFSLTLVLKYRFMNFNTQTNRIKYQYFIILRNKNNFQCQVMWIIL